MLDEPYLIHVFGDLAVSRGDVRFDQFPSRHSRDLFLLLVLAQGQPLTRLELTSTLWPECGEAIARNRLSVALASLRRALEATGLDLNAVVQARKESLKLALGSSQNEWVQFWDALERSHLLEALTLYRGHLVPACSLPQVVKLRGHALTATKRATALAVSQGDEDDLALFALRTRLSTLGIEA
ncbi:MAG: hypothetical protein JSS66_08330 [Armatimonadetes bacterium]|nr:hypothetical protein [Armatimonadota bacterium]